MNTWANAAPPAAEGSGLELYNIAIVVLSCLLFIAFLFALAIIGITVKKAAADPFRTDLC